jgi:PleD family two-component response regulator
MEDLFRVTIHYNNDYGYVEYSPATKSVKVVLDDDSKREVVEKYLTTEQTIQNAQTGLLDFVEVTAVPSDSLEMMKLALTRMWGKTGVLVDWSHPVTVR